MFARIPVFLAALTSATLCSGTLSSTRFSVNCSNRSGRSRNDVEDVGTDELEELVDKPGTTIGT